MKLLGKKKTNRFYFFSQKIRFLKEKHNVELKISKKIPETFYTK